GQLIRDAFVGLFFDMRGRDGSRPQQRHQFPAGLPGIVDEPADAEIDTTAARQDLVATAEREVSAALFEVFVTSRCGRERVRLVQKPADGYTLAHSPHRRVSVGSASQSVVSDADTVIS